MNSFSESDRSRIAGAVKEAEAKTSGEIVPYVVEASDVYEEAEWKGAAVLGVAALLTFAILYTVTPIWLPFDIVGLAALMIVASGIGALLVHHVAWLKRLLAGKRVVAKRVHQRAIEAFVAEEVFSTKERTGILIFLSLLEHQVYVLGDAGINAKVRQTDWQDVVHTIVDAVKKGKTVDGLVSAIKQCGTLLQREGVQIRPDDTDELPDYLRVGDAPER
jgi:putative membrane protein